MSQNTNQVYNCEYYGCTNTSETHSGMFYEHLDDAWVCSECEDKLNPGCTGYCGVSCQLGCGCDQSC